VRLRREVEAGGWGNAQIAGVRDIREELAGVYRDRLELP